MGTADLHIHSSYSDGHATPQQIVDYAEQNTNLDIMAITDHEVVEGARVAQRYAEDNGYRIEVIIGSEATTRWAKHLLGLYLTKPLHVWRSLEGTIKEIHDQGGLAIAPHPFKRVLLGITPRELDTYWEKLDGLEVFNSSPFARDSNQLAVELNKRYRLAETGGSDAHLLEHVGYGITEFKGSSPAELHAALLGRTTRGRGKYVDLAKVGSISVARGLAKLPYGLSKVIYWGEENLLGKERF